MIHVYAITDRPTAAATTAGLGGADIDVAEVEGLGVAFSRHDRSSMPSDTEAVLAHAAVCDALMSSGCTVLPVRFGSRYADESALRTAIAERAMGLRSGLDRVRGRVELGVRVAWHAADEHAGLVEDLSADRETAATGTAYMTRRLAEERQREELRAQAQQVAGQIHADLSQEARDARSRVLATPGMLLSAAYLVDRDAVERFTQRVAEISASRTDLQLLCTGPWPPYNFVEGEGL